MLGKTVYWLSFAEGKEGVKDGIVVAETISTKGHRTYLIKTDEGKVARESAYVEEDKELADKLFEQFAPLAEKMKSIQDEAMKQCDTIRDVMLGEPEFPELVENQQ